MDTKPNTILMEIVKPIPENAPCRQKVMQACSFEDIAEQAGFEWNCLAQMEKKVQDGKTGRNWLLENGYAEFLKDAEEEDRTRMLGYLRMLGDMAGDLAEEEAEEDDDD